MMRNEPIFVGFDAKVRRPVDPDWLPRHVDDPCNATHCGAQSPHDGMLEFQEYYITGLLHSQESLYRAIDMDERGDTQEANEKRKAYEGYQSFSAAKGIQEIEVYNCPLSGDKTQEPYRIFAFRVHPLWFSTVGAQDELHPIIQKWPNPPTPDLSSFEFLDYDLVQMTQLLGCSPLFCNGMAKEIPVNRYCLIDEYDGALEIAELFARSNVETG